MQVYRSIFDMGYPTFELRIFFCILYLMAIYISDSSVSGQNDEVVYVKESEVAGFHCKIDPDRSTLCIHFNGTSHPIRLKYFLWQSGQSNSGFNRWQHQSHNVIFNTNCTCTGNVTQCIDRYMNVKILSVEEFYMADSELDKAYVVVIPTGTTIFCVADDTCTNGPQNNSRRQYIIKGMYIYNIYSKVTI